MAQHDFNKAQTFLNQKSFTSSRRRAPSPGMQFHKLRDLHKTLVLLSISLSPRSYLAHFFISYQIYIKPTSNRVCSSFSSTGSSLISLHSGFRGKNLNFLLPMSYSYCSYRWFSVASSNGYESLVAEVIDLISSGGGDLECKLNEKGVTLSADSVVVILGVLNHEKVPALAFFCWVRNNFPEICYTSDVCSLVVDNCGMLGDFDAMSSLLKEFASQEIQLNDKAFRFLAVSVVLEESAKKSVRRVIRLLKEVGGDFSVSGFRALVDMFNSLGSCEMAKFGIEEMENLETSERKVSVYNDLIKEMCHRLDFRRARNTLCEMRQMGFQPSVYSYNVLLSFLVKSDNSVEACEVFEEMSETGCPPNPLTFEIFISNFCQHFKFDEAYKFLHQMESLGLEPRLLTHAAFIKGFFKSRQYKEAHCYVVRACNNHPLTSNVNYSLLASLHLKKGNIIISRDILCEMINKGFRPRSHVYMKVLYQLRKIGREDLARDLQYMFSSLS